MIRVELVKLIRRPRSWVSVALLCGLPVLVAIFVAVTHLAPPPGQGPTLLSAVLSNGSLYPAAALAIVLPLFLPVAVAVVAGDSIAGEASSGMLRYLLARPVGRTRLLVAKLATLVIYTLTAVVAVAGTAYLHRHAAVRLGRRSRRPRAASPRRTSPRPRCPAPG